MSPERDGEVTRQRILDCIRASPGMHKSLLCSHLGLGWGTVGHHLRVLRNQKAVETLREGRALRVYPADLGMEDRRWLSLLYDDVSSTLVQHLHEEPGARLSDLSQRMGVSRKVVRRHLDLLAEGNIIQPVGEFQRRYHLHEDAAARLPDLMPTDG